MAALAAYFAARGSGPGPFFRFSNGSPLTRDIFVVKVRDALQVAGVENPSQYAGHSFRIGAATTAAAAGVEDPSSKPSVGGRVPHICYTYVFHGKD